MNRVNLVSGIIKDLNARKMIEIGAYKGEFAREILSRCSSIEDYVMVDPWQPLTDWNKPLNTERISNAQKVAQTNTSQYEACRMIKAKFIEATRKGVFQGNYFDVAYVDGDHTLKGITIDLICLWPLISEKGVIMGDDLYADPLHHGFKYEPTFVFPWVLYFAESVNAQITLFPNNQYMIEKGTRFSVVDQSNGKYEDHSVRGTLTPYRWLKSILKSWL
ncbi:MAG: class I SAM-dependent methyltransferase [Saprospiraceae bacterium]|nr:class I SAM-dependent methyltransferase [Saprospiraceae bacterium]